MCLKKVCVVRLGSFPKANSLNSSSASDMFLCPCHMMLRVIHPGYFLLRRSHLLVSNNRKYIFLKIKSVLSEKMSPKLREGGTLSDLTTGKILCFETSELGLAKRIQKAKTVLEAPARTQHKL